MATCYRHPGRETGVSCSNCGNPICPDCMTATPVGMRCPDCSRQKTRVHSLRSMEARPVVTYAVIAICVLAWIGTASSERAYSDGVLFGPLVADGEWWRLLTSGFLHSRGNPLHLLLNMYILWYLGQMLEPSLGNVRFAALYLAALFAGSFGVLLLDPLAPTVGASGAVYGLMGAALMMERARGIDLMQSSIGMLLLINLAFTFLIPGISIGGHLGGLAGGAAAGFLMDHASRQRRGIALPVAACVLVGVISVAGALAAATA
jgi:membrane associated rhomboid family serine protease